MQMKRHEQYCNSVAQANKHKSEFLIAGLAAKLPWDDLRNQASSMFTVPSLPPSSEEK
jgi:hypothetical protein